MSKKLSIRDYFTGSTFFLTVAAVILGIVALAVLLPRQNGLDGTLRNIQQCSLDGSCLGGIVHLESLTVEGNITAPNIPNNTCIESINAIQSPNIDFVAGDNIVVTTDAGSNSILLATTKDILNITMLAITQDTLLGNYTTCDSPLLPSCLDISGQMCMSPLDSSCWPTNATFDTLYVNNLILGNDTLAVQTCDIGLSISVDTLTTTNILLNGTFSCTNVNAGIGLECLNLASYSCPMGMPLGDSCIPANLSFFDLSVTNQLNANLVTCTNTIDSNCVPPLAGDVTGPFGANTVTSLQNIPITTGTPSLDAILYYNGVQWSGTDIVYSVPLVGDSVVARDVDGNITVGVMNAQVLQPPFGSTQCVGLGAPGATVGACAKADLSLDFHDILNVNAMYVDNLYGIGAFSFPNIAMHANLNLLNNSLLFNNDLGTSLFSPSPGIIQTNAAFTINNVLTASRFNGYNPISLPTVAAGTGAGTGPTITVTPGSTDCKLQVTVLTGTAPAANNIFVLTYATAATGTLTSGVVFSPASQTAAALTGTSAPLVSAETLATFTFRSGSVALAASTTYVWNFQTCA